MLGWCARVTFFSLSSEWCLARHAGSCCIVRDQTLRRKPWVPALALTGKPPTPACLRRIILMFYFVHGASVTIGGLLLPTSLFPFKTSSATSGAWVPRGGCPPFVDCSITKPIGTSNALPNPGHDARGAPFKRGPERCSQGAFVQEKIYWSRGVSTMNNSPQSHEVHCLGHGRWRKRVERVVSLKPVKGAIRKGINERKREQESHVGVCHPEEPFSNNDDFGAVIL